MVAHLLCKQGVRGSSPRASTIRKAPECGNAVRGLLLCLQSLRSFLMMVRPGINYWQRGFARSRTPELRRVARPRKGCAGTTEAPLLLER